MTDLDEFAEDVRQGLEASPRALSSRWLYDEIGSQIFEEICAVPEYYPTLAEVEILETIGPELDSMLPPELSLVELGSGSAAKARLVLGALRGRGEKLHYQPVDISATALQEATAELRAEFPEISIDGIVGEYSYGLRWVAEHSGYPKVVMWLGSNLGNFQREAGQEFVNELASNLEGKDRLLIGIDLRKDAKTLELAYDDPAGVTRRFTLNLITRMNRELDANFDVAGFDHDSHYEVEEGCIVIGLRSLRDQEVRVGKLGKTYTFAKDEFIHTEYAYKYSPEEIAALAAGAGMRVEHTWLDEKQRYSLQLLAPMKG